MRKKKQVVTPNNLRVYRRLLGYSQKEVAHMLGLTSATRISKWEKGTCFPSLENLFKLSLIYHKLANDLYFDFTQKLKGELQE